MFYVYVYYDPRPQKDNRPVYVGKGTGARDLSHWSRGSHNKPFQDFISHLKRRDLVAPCKRLFETENEQEAFAKEMQLIEQYGRRDLGTGPLFNRTAGGEGPSGLVKTAEQREADKFFSTEHWRNPDYRARIVAGQLAVQGTPQARAKKAEASIATWKKEDVREKRQKGIKAGRSTPESKAKTSAQAKAQWADPAYAAAQAERNREIVNRPEVKAAQAARVKAMWADPEFRAKRMASMKKKKLLQPT